MEKNKVILLARQLEGLGFGQSVIREMEEKINQGLRDFQLEKDFQVNRDHESRTDQ